MKKTLMETAVICIIAALVIATSMSFANPGQTKYYFIASFVFSFSLGFSNRGLFILFGVIFDKVAPWKRLFGMLSIGLLGTFIGTSIGLLILSQIETTKKLNHQRGEIILINLLFVVIIVIILFVIMELKRKNQGIREKLRLKEIEHEKLLRLKMQAELEVLQSKINPHFLFNTLNSIASLISVDPEKAEEMVEKLSALFRYTLRLGDNRRTSIGEELEIVKSYLDIEKLRFGKRLNYNIECSEEFKNISIPALLIQPLVENSIKYAISPNINGGIINISVKKNENYLEVLVEDSGEGCSETNSGGFGLRSIKERLALLYNEKAQMEIFHDGKTNVKISIPL